MGSFSVTAVWPWAVLLTSLSLIFLICRVEIIIKEGAGLSLSKCWSNLCNIGYQVVWWAWGINIGGETGNIWGSLFWSKVSHYLWGLYGQWLISEESDILAWDRKEQYNQGEAVKISVGTVPKCGEGRRKHFLLCWFHQPWGGILSTNLKRTEWQTGSFSMRIIGMEKKFRNYYSSEY